jgi:hypothetical protein
MNHALDLTLISANCAILSDQSIYVICLPPCLGMKESSILVSLLEPLNLRPLPSHYLLSFKNLTQLLLNMPFLYKASLRNRSITKETKDSFQFLNLPANRTKGGFTPILQ